MYPSSTAFPSSQGRTVDWKAAAWPLLLVLAGVGLTASAVAADPPADEAPAAADSAAEDNADAASSRTDEADASRNRDEDAETEDADGSARGQSSDGDELADLEEDALVVMVEPESPESKQVCRNVRVTGTRIPQRICRTVQQWDESDTDNREQAQRFLRELSERSAIVVPEDPPEMPASVPGNR